MPRRILSWFVFLLGALPLAACGDGGGGDKPVTPNSSEYGNGTPLPDVIGPAKWENFDPTDTQYNRDSSECSYPADQRVSSSGLTVVAIDNFDETAGGAVGNFYLQQGSNDPPPYSGVTAFGSSFSPPDLRLFPNDVVDFLGTKEEFVGPSSGPFSYCRTLPELQGTLTFRFDGTVPLEPKKLKIDDLIGYDNGRKWLGMLVRIEDVDVGTPTGSCDDLPTGCRYAAPVASVPDGTPKGDIPTIANELYDLKGRGPTLGDDTAGTAHFRSITGVVTFFYSFHIDPRSPEDFEP